MGDELKGCDDGQVEATGSEETRRQRVKAPRPSQCRAKMRRALTEEFEEIVKGFVAEAKRGSAAHVRLANELLQTPVKTKNPGEPQRSSC